MSKVGSSGSCPVCGTDIICAGCAELREKLVDARRQERKAAIALVNMSGKISGDGPKAILASIKVAEAWLEKESQREV